MSIFDRFLLAVYTLVATVFLLLFVAETAGLTLPEVLYDNINLTMTGLLSTVGVIILVGIRLFWISIRRSGHKVHTGRYLVLNEGEMGQVRISVQAVENLIIKVAGKMNGVKEVKPQILTDDKGVSVKILATVSPEQRIPETTEQMQALVKEKVREVSGVALTGVQVSIENIDVAKHRVE